MLFQSCSDVKKDVKNEEVSEVTATENAADTGAIDAEILYNTCKACHGEKGEGNKLLNAPALANQDAWYIERQLHNFKNGIRGADPSDINGTQMAIMAKTLGSDAAVKAVVKYIKTFPAVKPQKTLAGNIKEGEGHYNMICGACHGPAGVGNKSLNSPKLTGTDDWYLFLQFNNFKNGKRGSHPDDIFGSQMRTMSAMITADEDLTNILAYLQSLD